MCFISILNFCSDHLPFVNSLQGNRLLSKRPKSEEDEEFVESNGEEVSNRAICPGHLKVTEKPGKPSKHGNTEAPSEGEASDARIQADQKLLNDTKLSGKKMYNYSSFVTMVIINLMPENCIH